MKTPFFLLAIIIFFACSSKENPDSFKFNADSAFIKNYSTTNLKELKPIKEFQIGNEKAYAFIKPKIRFYNFKDFSVNKNVTGKILLTGLPTDIPLDGTLQLVYLATYNNKNELIDNLRIAKLEEISDVSNEETAIINGNKITRKTKSLIINPDGSLKDSILEESFIINAKGEIKASSN